MISLEYRDVLPLYRKIEDSLIRLIHSMALMPGDYLPSVREMASKNALNPVAVKQAYDSLVEQGYVERDELGYKIRKGADFFEDEAMWQNFDCAVIQLLEKSVSLENISERVKTVWGKEFGHDPGK